MNMALIDWMLKKQATVETSTFGAEFVALKHGIERVRGLRYKLRMMGVQISGPTDIYGDNMSVINNTQHPESTLKKKSEQKTELREWQNKGGAKRGRSDARTKKAKFEKAVAAAVEKKISEQAKASEEEKLAGEKLRSLVASIIKETRGTTTSGR